MRRGLNIVACELSVEVPQRRERERQELDKKKRKFIAMEETHREMQKPNSKDGYLTRNA